MHSVSCVTAISGFGIVKCQVMVGPQDLSANELERFGLATIERRISGESVMKVYCARCGSQVAADNRESDPHGWWACGRGCNTRFESVMEIPITRRAT